MNLMDYSLLVGIHDMDIAAEEKEAAALAESEDAGEAEENGLAGGESGGDTDEPLNASVAPGTPPDSPMNAYPQPVFEGILDSNLEQFAIKCSDRK